ncbi:MAG: glycosyltransferase family 9 protein [Candidatus Obscuribacterales bacterium]|nr:glycosyltransferase family 9 protein [Candidatus Obscuribacterales bacterium]
MRVLIVKMSALGDIIHSLPVAARLKRLIPGLELDWLVEPLGLPLLQDNPAVDKVFVFEKKKWWQQLRSVSGLPATAGEFSAFVGKLRSRNYDAAIDLQGLLKSSLLAYFSGAPVRFGFKGTREGAEHLLTHRLDVGDYFGNTEHVVDLNLRLADYAASTLLKLVSEKLGIEGSAGAEKPPYSEGAAKPEDLINLPVQDPIYMDEAGLFPLPETRADELAELQSKLGSSFVPQLQNLVFIPGTTWETKIWPTEKWIELGRKCAESGWRIILVGGPAEQLMNERIATGIGAAQTVNLTGSTSIRQLIALFREVRFVVGADTGPLHLAAAVPGCRVLGVFGSTPMRRNGPYGSTNRGINLNLDCQPCFEKKCPLGTIACLRDLQAIQVYQAFSELASSAQS